ncbi:hypothetical protein CRG98_037968 [Punica granatum]|uniref:Uncharacterized protein n=1 Tax=Punica granatum TaxID=22663 RepID=A0A2I0ICE6_PUNGR|nr:hypothetical protein CRG98_037968 [Punica granatum]
MDLGLTSRVKGSPSNFRSRWFLNGPILAERGERVLRNIIHRLLLSGFGLKENTRERFRERRGWRDGCSQATTAPSKVAGKVIGKVGEGAPCLFLSRSSVVGVILSACVIIREGALPARVLHLERHPLPLEQPSPAYLLAKKNFKNVIDSMISPKSLLNLVWRRDMSQDFAFEISFG